MLIVASSICCQPRRGEMFQRNSMPHLTELGVHVGVRNYEHRTPTGLGGTLNSSL